MNKWELKVYYMAYVKCYKWQHFLTLKHLQNKKITIKIKIIPTWLTKILLRVWEINNKKLEKKLKKNCKVGCNVNILWVPKLLRALCKFSRGGEGRSVVPNSTISLTTHLLLDFYCRTGFPQHVLTSYNHICRLLS